MITRAESFKGGVARLSFVIPASAQGKTLKVTVTIKSGGRSTTRIANIPVKAPTAS